ncbi:condensation domain-containing protein [Streptomyces diastatochromogenes]|nr:condensation domain-containing protein [Streptomyces diastatochromogenes]
MTAPTAPTQEELRAELLRRRLAARKGTTRPQPAAIPPADRTRPLALSAGQRQLWFLHQLDPDSPEYLLPMAYRLRGTLDADALRRAADALAARHEILRTRYALDGTEPCQVVDPAGTADFAVIEAGSGHRGRRRRREHRRAAGCCGLRRGRVRGAWCRCGRPCGVRGRTALRPGAERRRGVADCGPRRRRVR